MSDAPELARLHYLTDSEVDLILDFRLLPATAKECISEVVKLHSRYHVKSDEGNVIGIRRAAD